MAGSSWQGYLKLLRDLTHTLEQLTQVEREKNEAAAAGDVQGVEACMKREQAMSMSLRGYDQKRTAMLAALSLADVRLSGLADRCPEELRLEAKATAEELRRQYGLFKAASEVARHTLELNLRAIERVQNQRAGDAAQADEERKTHQTDFRA